MTLPSERKFVERLRQFYDHDIDIEMWLDVPRAILLGKSPRQLIAEGNEAEVDMLIAQLEDGVFI
jgi:hypothetical protein